MLNNYDDLKRDIAMAHGNKKLILQSYESFIDKFRRLNKKYKFSVGCTIKKNSFKDTLEPQIIIKDIMLIN